jgi:hypothetical protein
MPRICISRLQYANTWSSNIHANLNTKHLLRNIRGWRFIQCSNAFSPSRAERPHFRHARRLWTAPGNAPESAHPVTQLRQRPRKIATLTAGVDGSTRRNNGTDFANVLADGIVNTKSKYRNQQKTPKGNKMRLSPLHWLSILAASAMPLSSMAAAPAVNDFPTRDRVEFVLECMKEHGRDYEYFYKCSCQLDEIAKQTSYDKFSEIATAHRYARLGGERGAEFRDPKQVKTMSKQYESVVKKAGDACFITK